MDFEFWGHPAVAILQVEFDDRAVFDRRLWPENNHRVICKERAGDAFCNFYLDASDASLIPKIRGGFLGIGRRDESGAVPLGAKVATRGQRNIIFQFV